MRTFVALAIPVEDSLKTILKDFKRQLANERIKWVDINTMHLTLFFLGETKDNQVIGIKETLKERLVDFESFRITLKGIGTFGSKINPKVLWLGIERSDSLARLHGIVNSSLKPLGFTPDERGFNPHITIGRIKQLVCAKTLNELVTSKQNVFQTTVIDSIILYKSKLTPSGPVYSIVFEHKFKE